MLKIFQTTALGGGWFKNNYLDCITSEQKEIPVSATLEETFNF